MKTKITSMTTATLFITLMMTSLVGCGAISSNASETGASTLESISSDNEALTETGEVEDSSSSATDNSITISKSSEAVSGDLEDYQFMYNGNAISAMDDFETLNKALGEYDPKHSDGEFYTYGDEKKRNFDIYVLEKDGVKLPITLTIETDAVTTSRNIKVGSTKEEVIAAYGDPNVEPPKAYGPDGKELTGDAYIEMFGENLIYKLGDCQIDFVLEGGKVTKITYQNNINHDKFSWS